MCFSPPPASGQALVSEGVKTHEPKGVLQKISPWQIVVGKTWAANNHRNRGVGRSKVERASRAPPRRDVLSSSGREPAAPQRSVPPFANRMGAASQLPVPLHLHRSCTSRGIGRQGVGSSRKRCLSFEAMPCRIMPLLAHIRLQSYWCL